MGKGIKYSARATSYDWGKSQNKGTPFIEVTFEVSDADTRAPGAQFKWTGYFTDATTDRTFKSLRYCGCTFPGNDATNLDGLTKNTVTIEIEETEYGPRVAWVDPAGSVNEGNRVEGGELKALAARLKGAVVASAGAATKGGNGARAAASNGPAPFEALPDDGGYIAGEDSPEAQGGGTKGTPF